jgi:hypothetical protein
MGRTTKEDYARHYWDYQGKPAQIKKTAQRVQARRDVIKEKGASAVAGKDVHHKRSIAAGGSNTHTNMAIVSRATNRASNKKSKK